MRFREEGFRVSVLGLGLRALRQPPFARDSCPTLFVRDGLTLGSEIEAEMQKQLQEAAFVRMGS